MVLIEAITCMCVHIHLKIVFEFLYLMLIMYYQMNLYVVSFVGKPFPN